jgi:medium-chain acyl-[acyl-carrier-protein] hydrolase
MAVELRNKLTQSLGDSLNKALPATLILTHPTIEELAKFLSEQLVTTQEKRALTTDVGLLMSGTTNEFKCKLFMFPYLGGGVNVYNEWVNLFDKSVQVNMVAPLQYFIDKNKTLWFDNIIDDISDLIIKQLDDRPYVFFGHSLGAFVAYSVSLAIKNKVDKLPQNLSLSAFPFSALGDNSIFKSTTLNKETFEEVLSLFDIPQDLKNNDAAYESFVNVALQEVLCFITHSRKVCDRLDIPVTAFYYSEDRFATKEAVDLWQNCTSGKFDLIPLSGNHFGPFTNENNKKIVRIIQSKL